MVAVGAVGSVWSWMQTSAPAPQIQPVKPVRKSRCEANEAERAGWRGIIWLPRRLRQPFISTLQSLDLAFRHRDNRQEAETV